MSWKILAQSHLQDTALERLAWVRCEWHEELGYAIQYFQGMVRGFFPFHRSTMAIACIPQTTVFADISYTRMLGGDPIDDSALQKLERRGSTSEVRHHRCSWSQRSWTNNRRLAQCFPDLGRSQLCLRGWSQTTYQVGCKIKWWLHGGENDLDRWDCRPSVSDQRNEEGCCQSTPWNLAKAPKTLEFRIYASFFPCGTYTFASVYRPISSSLPRERELGGNRYWHKEHYDSWTEVVSPH